MCSAHQCHDSKHNKTQKDYRQNETKNNENLIHNITDMVYTSNDNSI